MALGPVALDPVALGPVVLGPVAAPEVVPVAAPAAAPDAAPDVSPVPVPAPEPGSRRNTLIVIGAALGAFAVLGVLVAVAGRPREQQARLPTPADLVPSSSPLRTTTSTAPRATTTTVAPFARRPIYVAPLMDADTVYVVETNRLVARDRTTAEVRWEMDDERCSYIGAWAGPITRLAGDRLLARCDGNITGVRTADGSVAWQVELSGTPTTTRWSPTAMAIQYEDRLDVHDVADGALLWSRPAVSDADVADVDDDVVLWGNNDAVEAIDLRSGVTRWHVPVRAVSVAALDGRLWVRNKAFRVSELDRVTGQVLFEGPSDAEALNFSTILGVTADTIVTHSSTSEILSGWSRTDGRPLWRRQLDNSPYPAMVGARYVAYVRPLAPSDDDEVITMPSARLVVFDGTKGDDVLRKEHVQQARPWVDGDWVVYGSWDDPSGVFLEPIPDEPIVGE